MGEYLIDRAVPERRLYRFQAVVALEVYNALEVMMDS